METYEALLARRSVRRFTAQEVDDAKVDRLLQSAMAAPSACNKRPWEFYVIRNRELQERLRHVSPYTDRNSSLLLVVAGNRKRALSTKPNDFWIQDCAAAVENVLLEATELGLGACWCGLYPMVTPVKRVQRLLALEEHIVPMALLHLGYPDETPAPRTQYDEKRVHRYD